MFRSISGQLPCIKCNTELTVVVVVIIIIIIVVVVIVVVVVTRTITQTYFRLSRQQQHPPLLSELPKKLWQFSR